MADIIGGAIDLVDVQARARSIALKAEMPVGDVTIDVDARAMRQILINLQLSNAVKFTPDGGRVDLEASRGRHGDLVIRVTDTGIGMPPDAVERVFRPFERAHLGTAHEIEATGPGLPISRGLVLLHSGTIELASEVGKGTVATVTLPARRIVAARREVRDVPTEQIVAS